MATRWGFQARLSATFFSAVAVVASLLVASWMVANDAHDSAWQISHTLEVLADLADARAETLQIELSTQGFRISADPARLIERDAAIAAREIRLARLQKLTSDNPLQQSNWLALRQVIDERLAIARRVEGLRRSDGPEAANAFAMAAPLQATRDRSRALFDAMVAEETRLLGLRTTDQQEARRRLMLFAAMASLALLLLLAATHALMRRKLGETEASRAALAESEERSSITLGSIGDAVIATDTRLRVTQMNRVAERLTGWTFSQARGHPIGELLRLLDAATRTPVPSPVEQVLATGEGCEMRGDTLLVARDGREMPVADSAAPIHDRAGQLCGVVIVFRDESLARDARRSIEEQNALLEQRVIERTSLLEDRESHLRSVINNVPALIAFVNADQRYGYVNASYQARFAPDESDITNRSVREVLGEARYAIAQPLIERALRGESLAYDWEPFPGVWQMIRYAPKFDAARRVTGYYVLGTDITERRQLERAQRDAAVVFEKCHEGIVVTDARGQITHVNPAFTRITGYTEAEVLGRSPRLLASGRHDAAFYRDFWDALRQDKFWQGEFWNRNRNGELYAVLQSVSVVEDETGSAQRYIGVFADITQAKAHESELDRAIHCDALTGLPNRRLLSDRVQQAIVRADRHGRQCAVCVLDLDDFTRINTLHGNDVGDQYLVGVAEHIKAALRGDDTLARLGGDEFVMLLSDLASAEQGAQVLDRILVAVQQPVHTGGHHLSTSASIGVSLYPADHVDPDALLRHADHAMLLAKQGGKNRYQLFDPEIDRVTQLRRDHLQRIAQALVQDEFELHYQPKVDLIDGTVIGAEALIRWRHPERGLLSPGEFLPQMQGSDLEQPLGDWVIESALRQVETWAAMGLDLPVSVNVSAHHLMRPDFQVRLAQALGRHPGLNPSRLELEVLETAAIADIQQAVAILIRCSALGVAFALDDFGTGYSSLTYLRTLPVQTLKIDQSFVRDMLTDQDDLSIVQGVIQLAAAFRRRVIAEGVETLAHGAALRAMGCRFVQGYGIARPMPAADLRSWCETWRQNGIWLTL